MRLTDDGTNLYVTYEVEFFILNDDKTVKIFVKKLNLDLNEIDTKEVNSQIYNKYRKITQDVHLDTTNNRLYILFISGKNGSVDLENDHLISVNTSNLEHTTKPLNKEYSLEDGRKTKFETMFAEGGNLYFSGTLSDNINSTSLGYGDSIDNRFKNSNDYIKFLAKNIQNR